MSGVLPRPAEPDIDDYLARRLGHPVRPRVRGAPARPRAQFGHIGRYLVTGALGAGGMGEVLRGHDPDLGRDVAIKTMTVEADRWHLERFVTEARITGQLEHPNIVPIHELGVSGGEPYFTMKPVEGHNLKDLLGPGGSEPPLVERLEIFLKVCDAVGFAHSRGVVHRDLKPANVLVGPHGEVMVCDWGLAKILDRADLPPGPDEADDEACDAEGLLLTLDGTVVGTPAYMSPEQAAGDIARNDERSDIYALGALLYEMLTGSPAYGGMTRAEMIEQVLAGEAEPPSQRAADRRIPWELDAVVMQAMALRRRDRYQSVAALRGDIARFLEGRVLAAVPYPPLRRLVGHVRANAVGIGVAVLAVALAASVAGWARRARSQAASRVAYHAASRAAAAERVRVVAAERRTRTLQALVPVQRHTEVLGSLLHVGGVDPAARRAALRRDLAGIARLAAGPDGRDAAAAWATLGAGQYLLRDLGAARSALGRAALLAPGKARTRFLLGRLCLDMAMAADLAPAGAHDPEESAARRAAAVAHLAAAGPADLDAGEAALLGPLRDLAGGRWAEALAACRREIARDPDRLVVADLRLAAAWALHHTASPVEAVGAVSAALRLRPHDAWARYVRGALRWRWHLAHATRSAAAPGLGRLALADLDAAVGGAPWLAPARLVRGQARMKMGDAPGALADFDAARAGSAKAAALAGVHAALDAAVR